jgi:hypothetical protein
MCGLSHSKHCLHASYAQCLICSYTMPYSHSELRCLVLSNVMRWILIMVNKTLGRVSEITYQKVDRYTYCGGVAVVSCLMMKRRTRFQSQATRHGTLDLVQVCLGWSLTYPCPNEFSMWTSRSLQLLRLRGCTNRDHIERLGLKGLKMCPNPNIDNADVDGNHTLPRQHRFTSLIDHRLTGPTRYVWTQIIRKLHNSVNCDLFPGNFQP